MDRKQFKLIVNQEHFWNRDEFLEFLVSNQGLPIEVSTRREGICLSTAGIYKLLEIFKYDDVTIVTSNPLEQHADFKIKVDLFDQWFKEISNIDPCYQTWNKSKIFGCFYNRPAWYRIGLGSYLHVHHNDKTLMTFRANPRGPEQFNRFDLNSLLINSPTSIDDFAKFMPVLPLTATDDALFKVGERAYVYEESLKNYYPNFFVEIVAETWTEGNTFAPTEKTTRPINFKKPFITYASRDYLCYLRQMGFRTFHDFWNEDYDGYDGVERFKRILSVIDELSQKSINELESMYQGMQDILDHNHDLLINKKYSIDITRLD